MHITHSPRQTFNGPQYMFSLCGVNSVSSASNPELVTCPKCLSLLEKAKKTTGAKAEGQP